ncbi:MAG: substrate-binding domain-containing protein [Desulfobacterales bacterium]|nr:substrate-binding domain-containing protein [Desulfobacterales bacterium]
MRKTLLWVLILLLSISMVTMISLAGCSKTTADEESTVTADEETTVAAAEEDTAVTELREAVGYDWNPTDPSKWTITTSYKKDPPYTIGLSTNHMAVTWMDIYKAEMIDEINMYGDKIAEFIHVDAGGDIPTQIANIEDLISRQVDAIIIDPASPTALELKVPILCS